LVSLKGWFKHTLPEAPVEWLAVAHLDRDMYESTMTAIEALYPESLPGGFLIVGAYGAVVGCKRVIEDYLRAAASASLSKTIDWTGLLAQAVSRAGCWMHCGTCAAVLRTCEKPLR
jgi:O-methyltransferase